jgi:hypothetical protein
MSEGISSTPNKTSCILQRTGSLREKYEQSGLDYITKPPNDPAGMAYSVGTLSASGVIFSADEETPSVGAGLVKIPVAGKVGAFRTGSVILER